MKRVLGTPQSGVSKMMCENNMNHLNILWLKLLVHRKPKKQRGPPPQTKSRSFLTKFPPCPVLEPPKVATGAMDTPCKLSDFWGNSRAPGAETGTPGANAFPAPGSDGWLVFCFDPRNGSGFPFGFSKKKAHGMVVWGRGRRL